MILDILIDVKYHLRCEATVVVGEKGSDVEKVEFGSRADPRSHRGGRCEFDPAHWNRGGKSRRHNGGRRPDARRVLSALSQQGASGLRSPLRRGREVDRDHWSDIKKGGLNGAVDGYLSKSHRNSPTPICPFAALGSELGRSGKETKATATEVLEKLFVTLAANAADREEARGDVIVALSTMIGAMTLARVVADSDLSSEILDRAKDHLHRQANNS